MQVVVSSEPDLSVEEFVDVLRRSALAARRPVHQTRQIALMLQHADILMTARNDNDALVGVARAISDFSYCTYLSDLAVDEAYQRQGVGKRLIAAVHEEAGHCTSLILLAAPQAAKYYPHIGMQAHTSCWWIRGQEFSPTDPRNTTE